jgi:hypothetical protein
LLCRDYEFIASSSSEAIPPPYSKCKSRLKTTRAAKKRFKKAWAGADIGISSSGLMGIALQFLFTGPRGLLYHAGFY